MLSVCVFASFYFGSSSARCFFSCLLILLPAERWVWQYASLSLLLLVLADVFLLGQELGAGYVFSRVGVSPFSCIRLAHQDAKSHYSEISALLSWWQQECCTDGCSAAVRSSGDWQQDLSSLANSSPHHQTDALKMEEHTQMGHCRLLSFHAHDICLLS